MRPVGESREIPFDARVIVATNRDLEREVEEGRFRRDLFYRLNVFPIEIPPLRERPEDIPALSEHLLERIEGPAATLTPSAAAVLAGYDFPGNVRELLNVLRRASVFAGSEVIDGALLEKMIHASVFGRAEVAVRPSAPSPEEEGSPRTLSEVERAHIERVLAMHGGNVTRAAIALGIDRRTLQRKLRSLGVRH